LLLVVSTSAISCMERLVSKMTYYMSSGTLNLTHSLTPVQFHVLHCRLPVSCIDMTVNVQRILWNVCGCISWLLTLWTLCSSILWRAHPWPLVCSKLPSSVRCVWSVLVPFGLYQYDCWWSVYHPCGYISFSDRPLFRPTGFKVLSYKMNAK